MSTNAINIFNIKSWLFGILSSAPGRITFVGVNSLGQIAEQIGLVSEISSEALLASRIDTNIQAIGAGIYRIVGDR